jgi:hypothetical protein
MDLLSWQISCNNNRRTSLTTASPLPFYYPHTLLHFISVYATLTVVRTCYRHTWGFGGGTAPGDPERRERQLTRMRDNPLPLGQCPVIGAAPAALCSAR